MSQATTRSIKLPIINTDWPNLRAFAEWYLRDFPRSFTMHPPRDYIRRGRGSMGTILYRHRQFQAEYVVFDPGHLVRPHCHPNVSCYDILLRGTGSIVLGGMHLRPRPPAKTDPLRSRIPVLKGVVHSGGAGAAGASFLSLQHWHAGEAKGFIIDDWRDA